MGASGRDRLNPEKNPPQSPMVGARLGDSRGLRDVVPAGYGTDTIYLMWPGQLGPETAAEQKRETLPQKLQDA